MDFAYRRSLAPMMWVLVALGFAELALVHFLVALWNVRAALVLSVVSLAGILWLVALIRSFRRLPVRIEDDRLIMRAGTLLCTETALDNVAGYRTHWDATALKQPGILNLALIAYPNVIVDFREPVQKPGWRSMLVRSVAHRLDDLSAFTKALSGTGHGE